jgi:hypothetical protein
MESVAKPDLVDLHCVRRKHARIRDGQMIALRGRWGSERAGTPESPVFT